MGRPIDLKLHGEVAIGYFMIAALLGLVLRLMPVTDIALNYKFLLHAHSHIALLGWLYLGVTTILYETYLKDRGVEKTYRKLYFFTHITLLGMLFTFPFTGYALFSIIFSTLFLFASYWFTAFFIKHTGPEVKKSFAFRCFKWSLFYLVLSSLGPWALGGIMNTLGSQSQWYRFSIYFYLHFLYNGWAILTLAGLVFHLLEQHAIKVNGHLFRRFFIWMNAGILLTFFISIIWMEPSFIFYCLAVAGIIAQWVAFRILIQIFRPALALLKKQLLRPVKAMFLLTAILFGGKLALQTLVAIPFLTDLTYKLNDLVIGFLHWVFLGVLTMGLFTFLHQRKILRISGVALLIYMAGFLLTEFLLFYRATAIWQQIMIFGGFLNVLAAASALIPVSLFVILIGNIGRPKEV